MPWKIPDNVGFGGVRLKPFVGGSSSYTPRWLRDWYFVIFASQYCYVSKKRHAAWDGAMIMLCTDLTSPASRSRWSRPRLCRRRPISQAHEARVPATTVDKLDMFPYSTFTTRPHAVTRMRNGRASSPLPVGCARVRTSLYHLQRRHIRSPVHRWRHTIAPDNSINVRVVNNLAVTRAASVSLLASFSIKKLLLN